MSFRISVEEFYRRLTRGGVVQLLPVDAETWLRSVALPWEHADPADRVTVATAIMQGVPLLTNDAEISKFADVKCVW